MYILQTKKLTVDCRGSKYSEVAETIYNPYGRGDEIHLGKISQDVVMLSYKDFGSEVTDQSLENFEQSDGRAYFNIPALFHEFLHFSRFDNLPGPKHNELYQFGIDQGTKDLVYSCMAAAFPNSSEKWFRYGSSMKDARNFCAGFKASYTLY